MEKIIVLVNIFIKNLVTVVLSLNTVFELPSFHRNKRNYDSVGWLFPVHFTDTLWTNL